MVRIDLQFTRRLDPREGVSESARFADAVHIPASELAGRVFELPPRGGAVEVLDCAEAARAAEFLTRAGRVPSLVAGVGAQVPAQARGRLWSPTPMLERAIAGLSAGRALDLGCGVGRDAVFLAAAGWAVTAIDILPDALERGRLLLSRYAPECAAQVRWVEQDLRIADGPALREAIEDATLIVLARFAEQAALNAVARHARGGATLVAAEFSADHTSRFDRRSSKPTRAVERALADRPDWAMVARAECADEDASTSQFIARRRG